MITNLMILRAIRGRLLRSATMLFATLSGCSTDEEGNAPAVERLDSAGVEIVETSREGWAEGEAWTVASQPDLSIGKLEGEAPYLFSGVAGVLRLEDGRIAVADNQTRQIRFFGADGVFLRSVGGAGEGPSEFPQGIYSLQRCGPDRLYAEDRIGQRILSWSTNGDFQRGFRLTEPGAERGPYAMVCTWDGGFVAIGWGDRTKLPSLPQGAEAMMYTQEAPVWVLDSLSAVASELGTFLSSERVLVRNGSGPHPFGRATKFAASKDHIYLGTGEGLAVRVYAPDGSLARIQRALTDSLVLDPGRRDAYLSADTTEVDPYPQRLARLANAFPPEVPGFTQLRASPEGYLWARRFVVPGDTINRWGVFAPDGAFLGNVQLPGRFTLFQVGEDYLLGVSKDELDVESVHLYELRKP